MNIYYDNVENTFLINQVFNIKENDEFIVKIQIAPSAYQKKEIKADKKNFLEIIFYSNGIGDYEKTAKVCTVKSYFDQENKNISYCLFSNYPDVKQISDINTKKIPDEIISLSVNSFMGMNKFSQTDFICEILKDLKNKIYDDIAPEVKFYIEDLLKLAPEDFIEAQDVDVIVADTISQQDETDEIKMYNYKDYKVTYSGSVDKPRLCRIENLFNNKTTLEIDYDEEGRFTFYLNNPYMPVYFHSYDGIKYDPMSLFESEESDESRQWLKMWMYAINDNLLYPEKMKDTFFDETFKMTEDNLSYFHSLRTVDRFSNQIIAIDDFGEPVFLSLKFQQQCHGHVHVYILSLDYESKKIYMSNEYMSDKKIMPDLFETKDDSFIFDSFQAFFDEYLDDDKVDEVLDPEGKTMKMIFEAMN